MDPTQLRTFYKFLAGSPIFAFTARDSTPRMWPHDWAGYLLLILSLAHAWIPMAAGRMPTTSLTDLWLATLALALLFFQLLGLPLQTAGETRRFLRVAHFWTMLVFSVLVLAHVYLNSSLILMRTVRLGSWLFPRSFIL